VRSEKTEFFDIGRANGAARTKFFHKKQRLFYLKNWVCWMTIPAKIKMRSFVWKN